MKHTNKKKGFTLVELVIVIAVIAILAGVMVATFSNVVDKANKSADLQEVKSSLDAEYYDFIAEGQLPTALLVDGKDFVAFSNEIATPSAKKWTPLLRIQQQKPLLLIMMLPETLWK
ncbi:MAG: type II secretion system protein [Clostridiales bacterium]|nr:type II secretion system protein [Clostridiales bacterium]